MTSVDIYELGQKLQKERAELGALLSDPSVMTAEQVDEARKREAGLKEMQAQFDRAFEADRLARENKEAQDRIGQVRRPVPAEGAAPEPQAKSLSLREAIATSAGFKTIQAKGGNAFTGPATYHLGNVKVDDLLPQFKTLFQNSAAPQEDERLTRIVLDEQEERSILDLPAPGTMSMPSLSYLEETTFTNNAAERGENGTLGEAAFAFTERTATARAIGTFVPVTEEALADVDFLDSYLRGRLGFQVRQRLASQLLNGDNVAPNIQGYYNAISQTQAKGSDPVFDAIYKGITLCRVTGFAEPDAIVMHPNDFRDIRLERTGDGVYIMGNPSDPGANTLFGLPVVETTHATENTALVGAFRAHSQFFVRQGMELAASNQNEDYFIKLKVAIRAYMRGQLVVYRASAFTEVTGI